MNSKENVEVYNSLSKCDHFGALREAFIVADFP